MNVLLSCEESQAVCLEFRGKGHNAFSCDILQCSGGHPEWHLHKDVKQALFGQRWDLVISFPPCTHLSLSGAKHFEKKRLSGEQLEAITFFLDTWEFSHCTENPRNIMSGWVYLKKWYPQIVERMIDINFPKQPTQVVQPYFFGDPFTKTTCLWLKGVPTLKPTNIVDKGERHITKGGNSLPTWYNIPPSPDRAKLRSKTFPGLAKAMAEQWGVKKM